MSQPSFHQALEAAKQAAALVKANPQVQATTQPVIPTSQGAGPAPAQGA